MRHIEQIRLQAIQNDPEFDFSLDNLVEADLLHPEALNSPFGPVGDGRGDYWFAAARPEIDEHDDLGRHIVAYDRAMYADHDSVNVMYLDGTFEELPVGDFTQIIANPPNAGREFDLPPRTQ